MAAIALRQRAEVSSGRDGRLSRALEDIDLEVQRPGVRRDRRPVGLRQDDLPAHGRRVRVPSSDKAPSAVGGKPCASPDRTAPSCSSSSRCFPGRPCARTSTSACAIKGVAGGRARASRIAGVLELMSLEGARRRLSAPALRRHAAARRDRARLCARPGGAADGRAVRRARRADARRDAGGAGAPRPRASRARCCSSPTPWKRPSTSPTASPASARACCTLTPHLWQQGCTPVLISIRLQQTAPINVSYQPALYWALPFYVATEKGWWKEVGLAPSFSTFPAGAPQIAAAQAKSWDVGGTGSVPAVLGAARFGIMTIGITNDESKANALMVRGDKFDAIKANPAKHEGPAAPADDQLDGRLRGPQLPQEAGARPERRAVREPRAGADHLAPSRRTTATFAGVWAPNTYTLEERANAKYLCSGDDAGASCPARSSCAPTIAKEQPGGRREVPRRLPARLELGQGQPGRGPRARRSTSTTQGGRRDVGPRDGPGVRAAPDLRPRRAAASSWRAAAGGRPSVDGWFTSIGDFMTERRHRAAGARRRATSSPTTS